MKGVPRNPGLRLRLSLQRINKFVRRSGNLFNFRNKTDSIFAKIPGGNLTIAWDASFGVDITVFQEKSEPDFEEVVV